MTLAARIRDRREQLGLTQAAAAARASMGQPDWSRLEAGRRADLPLSTLRRLAAALECSVGELVDGTAPRSCGCVYDPITNDWGGCPEHRPPRPPPVIGGRRG
jgi:transcriptional regulator with XRE-family HTH domain